MVRAEGSWIIKKGTPRPRWDSERIDCGAHKMQPSALDFNWTLRNPERQRTCLERPLSILGLALGELTDPDFFLLPEGH